MPNYPKDWKVEPETDGIPDNAEVIVKVTSMEEELWGTRGAEDKFCIIAHTRIKTVYDHGNEVTRYKNMPYDLKFTIGHEADKDADGGGDAKKMSETWKRFPAQQYGHFLEACGYKAGFGGTFNSTAEACEVISNDQPELAFTNQRKASRNDPEGKKYNNPTRFKKVGTVEAGTVANGLDNTVKRVAPAMAKKVVETYVEDDE